MIVCYQLVHPNAKVPTLATAGAAGWDLYLPEDVTLWADTVLVPLGFRMEIPDGWEASIRPRSGLHKRGICIPNSPATIDSDYRGIIHVALQCPVRVELKSGERIAQMLFAPVPEVWWEPSGKEGLKPTARGEGGFGSTGK